MHPLARKFQLMVLKHGLVHLPRRCRPSDVPVTIVMPLAVKDLATAEIAITGLRRHLRHPIERIVVPGQSSDAIAAFCRRIDLDYRDETTLLPASVLAFDYAYRGHSRTGWIRQQILKLSCIDYTDADTILVADADTVFIRDIAFLAGDRQVLFTADEYNAGYHAMSETLLGPLTRQPWSFVTHSMLFRRSVLAQLRGEIEAHTGMGWVDAILANLDTTVAENLSEYELYGNFLAARHPHDFVARYWYNRKVAPDVLADAASAAPGRAGRYTRFNSLSAHVQTYAGKAPH